MGKKDDNNPRRRRQRRQHCNQLQWWILISVLATVGAHVGENTEHRFMILRVISGRRGGIVAGRRRQSWSSSDGVDYDDVVVCAFVSGSLAVCFWCFEFKFKVRYKI
jgi:hypothetical protein